MPTKSVTENPPAFPESVAVDHMDGLNFSRNKGMTLRDYFAAAAVQGILASKAALLAYDQADALLVQRAKGGQ